MKINTSSANITSSGNITIESTGSGGVVDIKTSGNNKVKIDGLNFKSHKHDSGTLIADTNTGVISGNTGTPS